MKEIVKKLLEKLLEFYQITYYGGLCYCIKYMVEYKLLSIQEHYILVEYFKNNRPKNYYKRNDDFWYEPYQKRFRIQWLKKHIKLNS